MTWKSTAYFNHLNESAIAELGQPFYRDVALRGRPNDPPDCEALDPAGRRLAIEVTELVSQAAIQSYKAGRVFDFHVWTKSDFLSTLSATIDRKDAKYPELKDPPYEAGYELVVFTDEPMLGRTTVEEYLDQHVFDRPKYLSRVTLLLGYDPGIRRCPYYELTLQA